MVRKYSKFIECNVGVKHFSLREVVCLLYGTLVSIDRCERTAVVYEYFAGRA